MVSKLLVVSTVAALSLATTAFAATPGYSAGFDNATLPENGQNGAVQSANSLPPGFDNGTTQQLYAQSVNRWFAQQGASRHYAQARQAPAAN